MTDNEKVWMELAMEHVPDDARATMQRVYIEEMERATFNSLVEGLVIGGLVVFMLTGLRGCAQSAPRITAPRPTSFELAKVFLGGPCIPIDKEVYCFDYSDPTDWVGESAWSVAHSLVFDGPTFRDDRDQISFQEIRDQDTRLSITHDKDGPTRLYIGTAWQCQVMLPVLSQKENELPRSLTIACLRREDLSPGAKF